MSVIIPPTVDASTYFEGLEATELEVTRQADDASVFRLVEASMRWNRQGPLTLKGGATLIADAISHTVVLSRGNDSVRAGDGRSASPIEIDLRLDGVRVHCPPHISETVTDAIEAAAALFAQKLAISTLSSK